MSENFQVIANLNLWYVPLIALLLVILLGSIIGFINGIWTAIYFFVFNLGALLLAILLGGIIFDKFIAEIIQNKFDDENIKSVITNHIEMVKGMVILLLIIGFTLVIDLVALSFYFIFRKKLKRKIRSNKKEGHKTIYLRMIGGGVGTLSAIPIAGALSGLSVLVSNSNKINTFTSKITKITTFGKVENIYADVDVVLTFESAAEPLLNIITFIQDPSGNIDYSKTDIINNANAIKKMLSSKGTSDMAIELVKPINRKKSPDENGITDKIKTVIGSKFILDDTQTHNFKEIIKWAFSDFSYKQIGVMLKTLEK